MAAFTSVILYFLYPVNGILSHQKVGMKASFYGRFFGHGWLSSTTSVDGESRCDEEF
jgi:hypothetical protein